MISNRIQGGCLCGGVRFEIARAVGPFELCHCSRCGSPVPDPHADEEWFELPAGLLDGDPELAPDKHIFVELKAPWFEITDELPQLTRQQLIELRFGGES